MADNTLSNSPHFSQQSILTPDAYGQPDIASVCPICNHGFRDEHFATLIWINEHTPAHLTCCEQTDSRNPKLEGLTFTT